LIFLILLVIGFKISFQSDKFTDIVLFDEPVYLERGDNISTNKEFRGLILL